jgi:hypothetical protein
VYNAWYLKLRLLAGEWPNWSPYAACGQPFFKVAGLADSALLAGLMGLAGTFGGLQVYAVGLYLAAALGCFRLGLWLTGDRSAALFVAGAYVLSWFITFTAYFQAYLSNLLVYALLPWFALLYDQAVGKGCAKRALGAGLVLAGCITTNPQVALKVAAIGGVWVLLKTPHWRKALWISGIIALAALWVAAFNLVSALEVRREVLSVSYRLNTYTGPFTLVVIPLYALNLLWGLLGGDPFLRVPLWEVLYAEYPGLCVVLLAALSLAGGAARKREVAALWGLVAAGYGLFFLVVPRLPASEWVGTTHNLIIIPTFALALLCGYGVMALKARLANRAGRALGLLALAGVLELGGLKIGLVSFATTRTPPGELPEVGAWEQVAAQLRARPSRPRFYSYNPDHTVYLFPVLTGCATANVIELRQRLPEYESYLRFLRQGALAAPADLRPSRHLALLNAEYLDLAFKLYEYQGPNAGKGEYAGFEAGVRVFDADPDLERFGARGRAADDLGHDVSSTAALAALALGQPAQEEGEVVQVGYRHLRPLPAFVAPHTVAIVGDTRRGEQVFEQIAGRPDFRPDQVLYLLVESLDQLDGPSRRALRGYLPVGEEVAGGEVPSLSAADLSALYQEDASPGAGLLSFSYRGDEELAVALDRPVPQGAFLFVSQQRFQSWKAYDQQGEPLPLYKAEAGLSAVFLRPGTRSVALRYELSGAERFGRWFSGIGLLGIAGFLLFWQGGRPAQKVLEKKENLTDRLE